MTTTFQGTESLFPEWKPRLLVVDDRETDREGLAKILERHHFPVRQAANGQEALRQAAEPGADIVLIDNILRDEISGLELARLIGQSCPQTSVIFVSGQPPPPVVLAQARRRGVRIGGCVEKPLVPAKIKALLQLIDKVQRKLQLWTRLASARDKGLDPVTYLHALADQSLVSAEIFTEILADLQRVGERNVAAEIDAIYEQIEALLTAKSEDQDLPEELASLRQRLRSLQELEANEMEHRLRARFRFDPAEGRRLVEESRRALGHGE